VNVAMAGAILMYDRTISMSRFADRASLQDRRRQIQTSRSDGMYTYDECLAQLLREGQISERTARGLAKNPQMLRSRASKMRPPRVALSGTGEAS